MVELYGLFEPSHQLLKAEHLALVLFLARALPRAHELLDSHLIPLLAQRIMTSVRLIIIMVITIFFSFWLPPDYSGGNALKAQRLKEGPLSVDEILNSVHDSLLSGKNHSSYTIPSTGCRKT